MARKIKYIVIHHSADGDPEEGTSRDTSEATINEWHKNKGWGKNSSRHTGYHYIIRQDGSIETGRKEYEVGTHCPDYNSNSIGICHSGHISVKPLTKKQKETSLTLVISLLKLYNIPVQNVVGHGEVRATECPGKLFNMNEYRKELHSRMTQAPVVISEADTIKIRESFATLYNQFSKYGLTKETYPLLNKLRHLQSIASILDK